MHAAVLTGQFSRHQDPRGPAVIQKNAHVHVTRTDHLKRVTAAPFCSLPPLRTPPTCSESPSLFSWFLHQQHRLEKQPIKGLGYSYMVFLGLGTKREARCPPSLTAPNTLPQKRAARHATYPPHIGRSKPSSVYASSWFVRRASQSAGVGEGDEVDEGTFLEWGRFVDLATWFTARLLPADVKRRRASSLQKKLQNLLVSAVSIDARSKGNIHTPLGQKKLTPNHTKKITVRRMHPHSLTTFACMSDPSPPDSTHPQPLSICPCICDPTPCVLNYSPSPALVLTSASSASRADFLASFCRCSSVGTTLPAATFASSSSTCLIFLLSAFICGW